MAKSYAKLDAAQRQTKLICAKRGRESRRLLAEQWLGLSATTYSTFGSLLKFRQIKNYSHKPSLGAMMEIVFLMCKIKSC